MSKQIYEFRKNDLETVKILTDNYMGTDVLNIRTFVVNQSGEDVPTKKGLTLALDLLPELLLGLEKTKDSIGGSGNTSQGHTVQ